MAIVIEEKKNTGAGIVSFLVWLVILGTLAAAVYYLFFAAPELVEIVAPPSFKETEQIAQLTLNPQEVVSDPRFTALQQYVTLPPLGAFGRSNPFLGL